MHNPNVQLSESHLGRKRLKSSQDKTVISPPTEEHVKQWLERFTEKLKRETSRNHMDRLLLSVDRAYFENDEGAGWTRVKFQIEKGHVEFKNGQTEFIITPFQKKLLSEMRGFKYNTWIQKSKLKEETGTWKHTDVNSKSTIHIGGEAILSRETIGNEDFAVRVQAFDTAIFTSKYGNGDLVYEIRFPTGYEWIPKHKNVIENFSNIEIFCEEDGGREDCLGWITIMEYCQYSLRDKLKRPYGIRPLTLDERKRIAKGVRDGFLYLDRIGIEHRDVKPENILLKGDEPKLIDFGVIMAKRKDKSIREMGYVRRGSKYQFGNFLFSGTPAFSRSSQICTEPGGSSHSIYVFILSEWHTAWSLLFNPVTNEDEEQKIREKLRIDFNAAWLTNRLPTDDEIDNIKAVISINNSSTCALDDYTTKSRSAAFIRSRLTRVTSFAFKHVTQRVLDQKDSNLCVPISISILLRWALKNQLNIGMDEYNQIYTLENILTVMTMIVFPKSLAGLNDNPCQTEKEFQKTEVHTLLERLKFRTYLSKEGWEIISRLGTARGSFNYRTVPLASILNSTQVNFKPLSVTVVGYKRYINEFSALEIERINHQMTLDRVDKNVLILQNTSGLDGGLEKSESEARINSNRILYQEPDDIQNKQFIFDAKEPNPKFKPENFYLWPKAYSITLEKSILSSKESEDIQNDERRKKEIEASITQKTQPGQKESLPNVLRTSKNRKNRKQLKTIQEDDSVDPDEADLDLADNLQKLTEANVENWLEAFNKKLKRKSSRNYRDQLILSIERTDFKNTESARWGEFILENNVGKVTDVNPESKWPATFLQKKILENHYDCRDTFIQRSDLKEETGAWQNDSSLKIISEGEEAIVFEEEIEDVKFVARVQVFDPLVFTNDDELIYDVFYSKDFMAAKDKFGKDKSVIPRHKNVIQHFCNVEIYSPDDAERSDCLGWITLMPKAETDLRKSLKEAKFTLDERKKIAIDLRRANDYLNKIGITHCDLKPANILLKNGVPLITDFGLVMETSNRISYRQMGYSRKGSKYKDSKYLFSGTPGFTGEHQLGGLDKTKNDYILSLFCDWKTLWTLRYLPIDEKQRQEIDKIVESFGVKDLRDEKHMNENITKIISLPNTSSVFSLDDPNLTKSVNMSSLKEQTTKCVNLTMENLTKNILDQKSSGLCVPISVTALLRFAMRKDLGFVEKKDYGFGRSDYTFEQILTTLTMIVYPRSLAGLNPKKEATDFQSNEIETLLQRICKKTYLMESGWEIIRNQGYLDKPAESTCHFEKVLLNENFIFNRPLTVTGACILPDDTIFFHQMVLDRVDDFTDEYVIQNSSFEHGGAVLRIPKMREYYVNEQMMLRNNTGPGEFKFYGRNGEFMWLVNEDFGNTMKQNTWYLLPQAYSLTLVPK